MTASRPLSFRHLTRLLCAAGVLLHAWPAHASGDHDATPPKAAAKPAKAPAKAEDGAGATAEAAAPAAAAGPMDLLRQRLADRLAGKQAQADGTYEMRVSTAAKAAPAAHGAQPVALTTGAKAAPAAVAGHGAAPAAAAPRAVAARAAAGSVAPAALAAKGAAPAADGHAAHWSYAGAGGPAAWGGLKPEFSMCSTGQRQSPIDIRGGLPVDLDPVRFDYQPSRFSVVDNGHTVQVNLSSGNSIEIVGKRFELVQFHFHRPSEERIDGRQFEMSLHLVHKDDQGRLAVVGLLLDKGPAQPVVQKVWNNLPLERGDESAARLPIDLTELLPADRRYYTYMGSLTTPPCSEGVQWIVMRQPITVTPEQIEIFARIYPMNARPVQQVAGRRILQSN